LRSAAWADGLIEVREHSTVEEGGWVNFIPLSEVLG
jgi:molybdopterin molybdotransferase